MKFKDLNKGQEILIENAKKNLIPNRLYEQVEEVRKGKINPFLNKDGIPLSVKIIDDYYDGPEDKTIIIDFNSIDDMFFKIGSFFINKFGTFGIIYFWCIDLFFTYPKKKAEAKFRYILGRYSKEKRWIKSAEMRKYI